ncbi:MAG TPA: ABC transporter permease subunit [Isosphaeraceae bacterium]|jgi:hypothetical protein|nr:ABC transporter permease subunit [Isosphaeraceae bacterium]
MPLGPVFERELLTTARRARYYLVRFGFGLAMLALVWWQYRLHFGDGGLVPRTTSIGARTAFANGTVALFTDVQASCVYLITPAVVAGVIADEKQRKTLHYLLASRLTDLEIVLGKLAARLLLVLVVALSGLPILCAMTLYGTVDPVGIAAYFAMTPVGALFVGGLSILASTWARRVREAVLAVYIIEFLGIAVMHEVGPYLDGWPVEIPDAIASLNEWANPFPPASWSAGAPRAMEQLAWILALQAVVGLACVATALARLRPAARAQEGGRRRRAGAEARAARPRRCLLSRPAIGADPMLWKEVYVWRPGALIHVAAVLFTAVVVVVTVTTAFYGVGALAEIVWFGREDVAFGTSSIFSNLHHFSDRAALNAYLRGLTLVLSGLWLLCVGCMAAGGVTGEREADTWTSLTATGLEGREIVRAKLLGAVARPRAVLWYLALLFFSGVLLGAVHPAGFVATMAVLIAATWSAAAIGTYATLTSSNTMRAVAKTVVALVVVNGGYRVAFSWMLPDGATDLYGCAPSTAAGALWTYPGVRAVLMPTPRGHWAWAERVSISPTSSRGVMDYYDENESKKTQVPTARETLDSAAASVLCVLAHVALAAVVTALCFKAVDRVIGRPRRAAPARPGASLAERPGPGDGPGWRLQSAGVEAMSRKGAGRWLRLGRRS